MMNTKNIFFLSVAFLLMVIVGLFVYQLSVAQPKLVYVNNVALFKDFGMAKDLARKHKQAIESQKKSFDSLYNVYNILKAQKNKDVLKSLEQQLQQKDGKIREMENYLTKEVSQQVWDRLNVYVKDFGKLHEYNLILGTQGNGNVMYADEDMDVTQDLLEYANEKYEGN